DSFVISNNAFLAVRKIKDFFAKAEEMFENLNKDIQHQKPTELFVSDSEFAENLERFKLIDFTIEPLKSGTGNTIEIELSQSPQPSFHKNFELLIDDLKEKRRDNFDIWISFSTE